MLLRNGCDEILTLVHYKEITSYSFEPTVGRRVLKQKGRTMKNTLRIAAALLVAGCATTTTLSVEAERVRIIPPEAAAVLKCKSLGRVSSLKSSREGGMPSAHIDARNKVAKAGGNAFAITSQSITPQGDGDIAGDGYACASF